MTSIFILKISLNKSLDKANIDNQECPLHDLNFHINNGKLYTTIYDRKDNVFISCCPLSVCRWWRSFVTIIWCLHKPLVRFARICNNVSEFKERNLYITDKLLHQGFRYHKLVKTFTIQETYSQIQMYD